MPTLLALLNSGVCELQQQFERLHFVEGEKNSPVSFLLVLNSSPPIPTLVWEFCVSGDTHCTGEYCSRYPCPKHWCIWNKAVVTSPLACKATNAVDVLRFLEVWLLAVSKASPLLILDTELYILTVL